ncbi:Mitochondrial import inner membrane translocase subunit tim23 [Neolecta irregularis DAH-3]|uniref:Mitochondrial import inner membrane translocase subunit tim23 n=1 Tax=Neolecta irregularis (strain DAH-3) TaxID=1198029 RepID=A0A1U7LVG5_NEOID|nr:Mitochondrial import inner membrane translocase subunit tim23 [Neolecta irregularis DAH-3]|eukprot:OLL26634.1 Mitochondrial import inner membrane translocase subunit tim23 [Neolecta irregularis DAH-3]
MSWLSPQSDARPKTNDARPRTNEMHEDIAAATDFLRVLSDPAQLHPLANIGGGLDYLSLEDDALNSLPGSHTALPSRGWGDDLCYGTGTTYLCALSAGATWGALEALRTKKHAAASPKLRLNAILNAVTRRGPFLGNSAGVVALVYNGINSGIGNVRGRHDNYNSVAAGALAGALFKSTAGIRQAAVAGAIAASVAASWCWIKTRL